MWEECQTCSRTFASWHACCQHMNALDHWAPTYKCETCNNAFYNEQALCVHMNEYGHWKHYCKPCKRRFGNENELRMRLTSRVHRGINIACPFCKQGFTSASGLSHHLESGSCSKADGVNRETIYKTIRQRDTSGIFTNNLLEWHGPWSASKAWNGCGFECYLCHRQFSGQRGLDQHLKSPVHMQEI